MIRPKKKTLFLVVSRPLRGQPIVPLGRTILRIVMAIFALIGFSYAKTAPGRTGFSAVYDSLNKQMIIFGGSAQKGVLSDTWVLNIEPLQDNFPTGPSAAKASLKKEWENLKLKKHPPARMYHGAIFDPVHNQMIVYAGYGEMGQQLADIWAFDVIKKEWNEIKAQGNNPPARRNHGVMYLENNKMAIFGGVGNQGLLSDVWLFDIEKKEWEEIKSEETPPLIHWGSATYDLTKKQIIILANQMSMLSHTWIFNIEKKKWNEIETENAPTARDGYSVIYDPINKQMLVFGGYERIEGKGGRERHLSEILTLTPETNKWEEIDIAESPEGEDEKPPARCWHCAIYDSTNKQMIVFGGTGENGLLLDVWAFDIKKKSWNKIK